MKFRSLWPGVVREPSPSGAILLPLDSAVSTGDTRPETGEIEQEVTDLFGELRVPALRYLLSMGLPAADGEEILQEVFLALFQHLRRDRPRTNLRGWVFRAAHNLGLRRRRRNQKHPAEGKDAERLTRSEDLRPNPEERLSARQRYGQMRAVLSALPERDQACLSLRAEGLGYREIADVLGISLGSVSISIQRSIERLRRADR